MSIPGLSERAAKLYGWVLDQVELDGRSVLANEWNGPSLHWDSLWTHEAQQRYLGPALGEAEVVKVHLRRTIAAIGTGVIITLWTPERPMVALPVWDTEVLEFPLSRPTVVKWLSLDAVSMRSEVQA